MPITHGYRRYRGFRKTPRLNGYGVYGCRYGVKISDLRYTHDKPYVVIIILTLHRNTQRLRYGHLKKQTIEERMNIFSKHYLDRSSWTRTHPPPPRHESVSPLPPVELDVVMYKAKFSFKGQAGVVNIPIYSPFSYSFKSIIFLISFCLPLYY